MPLSPGQILNNRYRIVNLLGQGGFGAVYRAWDTNLDEPVALKESFETSPSAQKQFQLEAKLLFRLIHPNLPRVHDTFTLPGQGIYLVMDYIEGEDLGAMQENAGGPLPETQVLPWIGQVCDALEYLHSQNPPVIHRDIKPANIRITPNGKAVLVDFGIAKVYDPINKTTLSAQAVTPGYSPPEQYGLGTTDPRSDVYSLGATAYHLLTGQLPPAAVDITSGVAKSPLPAHVVNPAVSPAVGAALEQAMQLRRDQRIGSAAELKAALVTSSPAYVTVTVTQDLRNSPLTVSDASLGSQSSGKRIFSTLPASGLLIAILCLVTSALGAGLYWGFGPMKNERATKFGQELLTSTVSVTANNTSTHTATTPRPTDTVEIRPTNTIQVLESTHTPRPNPTATYTPQALDPGEFIRAYYEAINQRQYELTWSMLSANFKNQNNASGFDPYVDWWNTVKRVDVLETNFQEKSSTTVDITVLLRFTYQNSRVVEDKIVFELVKYSWSYGWKFESYLR